jgi:hypothetical protein
MRVALLFECLGLISISHALLDIQSCSFCISIIIIEHMHNFDYRISLIGTLFTSKKQQNQETLFSVLKSCY